MKTANKKKITGRNTKAHPNKSGFPVSQPVHSMGHMSPVRPGLFQRQTHCPCGGGCPRCIPHRNSRSPLSVMENPLHISLLPSSAVPVIQMAPAGTSPARPVSSVTRTTAWDRLPGDVQTVFKASYANRKPGQWIWYQSGVSVVKNVDVLHRKHPEYIRAFLRVYSRMKGVHLWSEVLHLRKISGPKGGLSRTPEIEFTPKDVFKLIGVLSSNLFCRDLGLSGAMKNIASLLVRKRTNLTGAMWREVVVSGMPGLHVTPGKTTIVHLDDKSPVQGRDKNGTCRYAARFMLTHASYDLWKWKNVTLFPGMKRRRGVRRRPGEVAPILEYRFRLLE